MYQRHLAWPVIAAALAATQLGATDCGGGITRDPGFDLWCGGALCAWKIERGDIRRVPTWHEADAGVELVAAGTAIEQFTPVNSHDGTCIRFDLIADVAENAQAELAIDIYGDGTVERTFEIPTAHWKPVSFAFAVKPPYTGIRFEIAKRGAGHAVVARMHAALADGACDGVTGLDGGPAPLGALCLAAGDCDSGTCAVVDFFGTQRCAGCDPGHSACSAGQVCGLLEPGAPERAVPLACVATAARVLGEQCFGDRECATGICTGTCSTCRPDAPPGTGCGNQCQQAYPHGPYLCSPRLRLAARGAPCASSEDCASGDCAGPERRQCHTDGRSCVIDANCPVDIALKPGACTPVGIQGGSCN
jgi:hypothetical protein